MKEKKILNTKKNLGVALLLFSSILNAEETKPIEFSEIWKSIQKDSPNLKSVDLEKKSALKAKDKSSKHWLPRVYLDARNYTTNDPALNFFSTLGQRKATESDFSTSSVRNRLSNYVDTNNNLYTTPNYNTLNFFAPDTLNYPGTNTYRRGTLGVDFSLYEGGSKSNAGKAYEKQAEGKGMEAKFIQLSEYSNYASIYGTINIIKKFQIELVKLEKDVNSILKRYQLRSKANPVGYSGLLGLKTLKNRIEGMKTQNESKLKSLKESINITSDTIPDNWDTVEETSEKFISKHLNPEETTENSYMVNAINYYAESAEFKAEAEKARIMPKVGLYGEAYAYNGSRSTATAFNAGVYVQMNLYSPGDLDSIEEAKLTGEAMRARAESVKKQEEAQRKTLLEMESSLKTNLKLIQESVKMMEEQTGLSLRLFGNGSINALQLSEVFSRKADLLSYKTNIEIENLKVKSALYMYSK